MKNKKIIILIIAVLLMIIVISAIIKIIDVVREKNIVKKETIQNEVDIKTNKDTIYGLFNNFPESNNIYYISKNLYNKRNLVGPTIYQLEVLAELTDEGYNSFIEKVEFQTPENFEMSINPNNIQYNWKEVKNIQTLESKNIENASVKKIYLDEERKTIYIIAMGGN